MRRDYLESAGRDPGPGDFDRVIVRAVGMAGEPEIQIWDVVPSDMVLLTTGVHDLLSTSELGALFCADAEELARRAMQEASSRPFEDDIAVVAFHP